MASTPAQVSLKVGSRVEVIGKGLIGTVGYVGMTSFASGKWIGVALDDARGKNDGTVQGKKYFTCPPNHGIFVRQSQVAVVEDSHPPIASSTPEPAPRKSSASPLPSGLPKPKGLLRPGFSKEKLVNEPELQPKPTEKPQTKAPDVPKDATPEPATPQKAPPSGLPKPSEIPAASGIPPPGKSNIPGVTPSATPISTPSPAPGGLVSHVASEEFLELKRKLIEKEKSVQDLEEKLATLKQKRAEDKGKLKDFDKMRMQNQQLLDYKVKWQETQKELQNQLRQAQKEAREAKEQLDTHSDDTQELHEAVEMATLDKEMAEEKYESLLSENDSMKDRIEELTLELEILKNEISEGGVESVAASAHVKQYEQQNARLKEAIVKVRFVCDVSVLDLRDRVMALIAPKISHTEVKARLRLKEISTNDKAELQKLQKQTKEQSQLITNLSNERDRATNELKNAEDSIDELKEQVDTALGAEEMVETLTDKNLTLEDEIEQLKETIADLEALRDLNEELEESHTQTERELREEFDLAMNRVGEAQRKYEASQDTISDYQDTITKFRELVTNLQNRIRELQDQQSSETEQPTVAAPTPEIDFKIKFAEIKQHARSIEVELRKFEIQEADEHINMLTAFLPDHFLKRGGEYDGVQLMLLLARVGFKTQLLMTQLREKHDIGEIVDSGEVLKGTKGDQASFATQFIYQLSHFLTIVKRYERAINTCEVSTYTRVSPQYPELAVHEKYLDHFIQLLSRDQLDDTIAMDPLEKMIKHYQALYQLHLASYPLDKTIFLGDKIRTISAGAECISIDAQRLKGLAQGCDEGSKFTELLGSMELRNMEIKQLCKKIKRRMPQDSKSVLSYPKEVMTALSDSSKEQDFLVRMIQDLASVSSHKASSLAEGESLLSGQLEETAWDCVTLVYEKEEMDPQDCISNSFKTILSCLSGVAIKLQEGEYDAEPPATLAEQPYLARSRTFKEEMSITTKLEEKIESRDHDILDLKRNLRAKAEELSEANIRIGLLEKRADNAAKEADSKVELVNKKLEQTNTDFGKKTKEYEETLDSLQADIDALESENRDLKKRLDAYSKKSLLTDLARQVQSPSAIAGLVGAAAGKPGSPLKDLARAGVAGAAPPVQIVIKDSPVVLAQLEAQRNALRYLKAENIRLKSRKLKAELQALPKIYVPPSTSSKEQGSPAKQSKEKGLRSQDVLKETSQLLKNLEALSVCPKVVDVTKRKPGTVAASSKATPINQLVQTRDLMVKLRRQKDELERKIQEVMTKEIPGAAVPSSYRKFVSPEYSKVIQERTKAPCIGRISFPVGNSGVQPGVHAITLRPNELQELHYVMVK